MSQTAYWPCPPDCLTCRPSPVALAAERLPQGYDEVDRLHGHTEPVPQPLERGVGVRLAHRPDDELPGLGVVDDPHRRVLGGQPAEGGGELVLVGLGGGLDRDGMERLRQRPRTEHAGRVDRGEGVAGLGPGQPADGGDVAGDDALRRSLLLAERVCERADPLVVVVVVVARAGAEERREVTGHVHRAVGVEGAGEDAHQADPADVRVAGRLHDLGHERPARVARQRVGGRAAGREHLRARMGRTAPGTRSRPGPAARRTPPRWKRRPGAPDGRSPGPSPAPGLRRARRRRSPHRRGSGPSGSRPRTPR